MDKSYDWDEIECPNRISEFCLSKSTNVLNHSEFFERKHETHEKNVVESKPEVDKALIKVEPIPKEGNSELILKNENITTEPDFDIKKNSEILFEDEEKTHKPKTLANLLQESWKSNVEKARNANQRPGNSKLVGPPSVYNYVAIYDKRKQHYKQEILKQEDEERKKRLFHSRPAPNFASKHALRKTLQITMPNTPEVLKRSQELGEIRKEKEESDKQKKNTTKFKARRNPFK